MLAAAAPSARARRQAESETVVDAFRKRFYELAGINEQELADALRSAFDTTKAQLSATKTELVTHQGDYTPVQVEDNPARLRAAEQVYDLTGVRVSKQDGSRGGSVVVQVNFPAHHMPAQPIVEIVVQGEESGMSEKNEYVNSQPMNRENVE